MTINTRYANRAIQDYVDQVEEGDDNLPPDSTIRYVSGLLDDSFHRAYKSTIEKMDGDPLITHGVKHLRTKRTCGGFKLKNASLVDLTPFEQMHVVSKYIDQTPNMSRQPRTYAFKVGDEVVPVWIRHPQKGSASLWTTLLGSTRGRLKAPPYEDLAKTDPVGTDHEVFIDPLTCLEMHRNPTKIGALAIKSASYDAGEIDHGWRFQNYNEKGNPYCSASAELKKQNTAATRKMVAQAAGYNFCELLTQSNSEELGTNLLPEMNYEDYASEGYKDDIHPFVSAKSIIKTFPAALKGDTSDLDQLTERVFASRLGFSQIDPIQKHVEEALFSENVDLGCIF